MSKKTRPPAEAPRGFLTIREAAKQLGISYASVYRHKDATEHVSNAAGVIFIPRADLGKITAAMRQPVETTRETIVVRIPRAKAAAWRKAAGRDVALTTWLQDLAEAELVRAKDERATW